MRILDEKFEENLKETLCERIDGTNVKKSRKEELKEGINNLSDKFLFKFLKEADSSKVSSREELLGLAKSMAKEAFGDSYSEEKVEGLVDKAIEDSKDEDENIDWENAAGIVVGSFQS